MKVIEKIQRLSGGAVRQVAFLKERTAHYAERALSDENEQYMAAAAYVPFIGWMLPLYLKPKSDFCQDHGKTGLLLSLFFLALVASLFFINLLIVPRDWRELRFGLVVLIYLSYGLYFPLCGYGIYRAVHGKKLENRWINRYKNVIPL